MFNMFTAGLTGAVGRFCVSRHLNAIEERHQHADPEANFEIEMPRSGALADLALREVERRDPGPGEIEMRIDGLGLTYKDALKVLGVLTEAQLAGTHFGMALGLEGIGCVTRVGPGVRGFAVGDHRWISVPGMSSRYVTTSVHKGLIEPAYGLNLNACGSVTALMTAHYALKGAARVQPGEWVLVCCGAGGIGMAAVQVAAKSGARVIATAADAQRCDLLLNAGADYVVDFGSLTATDEVRKLTGGKGVDVVVSSAPSAEVLANLGMAAEFGRVVEVGKSEIYGARLIDLAVFDKNLALISVDLDRMAAHRMDLLRELNQEVLNLIRAGKYELLPARVMPVSQLVNGFDLVARSQHMGRIVLDFTEPGPPVKRARPVAAICPTTLS